MITFCITHTTKRLGHAIIAAILISVSLVGQPKLVSRAIASPPSTEPAGSTTRPSLAENLAALLHKGDEKYGAKDFIGARQHFLQAKLLAPDDLRVAYRLTWVALSLQDRETGVDLINELFKLDPQLKDDKGVRALRQQIEALKPNDQLAARKAEVFPATQSAETTREIVSVLLPEIEQLVELPDFKGDHDAVWSDLAKLEAQSRNYKNAFKYARKINSEIYRMGALEAIACYMAIDGKAKDATDFIASFQDKPVIVNEETIGLGFGEWIAGRRNTAKEIFSQAIAKAAIPEPENELWLMSRRHPDDILHEITYMSGFNKEMWDLDVQRNYHAPTYLDKASIRRLRADPENLADVCRLLRIAKSREASLDLFVLQVCDRAWESAYELIPRLALDKQVEAYGALVTAIGNHGGVFRGRVAAALRAGNWKSADGWTKDYFLHAAVHLLVELDDMAGARDVARRIDDSEQLVLATCDIAEKLFDDGSAPAAEELLANAERTALAIKDHAATKRALTAVSRALAHCRRTPAALALVPMIAADETVWYQIDPHDIGCDFKDLHVSLAKAFGHAGDKNACLKIAAPYLESNGAVPIYLASAQALFEAHHRDAGYQLLAQVESDILGRRDAHDSYWLAKLAQIYIKAEDSGGAERVMEIATAWAAVERQDVGAPPGSDSPKAQIARTKLLLGDRTGAEQLASSLSARGWEKLTVEQAKNIAADARSTGFAQLANAESERSDWKAAIAYAERIENALVHCQTYNLG